MVEYVMGRTDREAQRLRDQSQLLEDYTSTIFTKVGLKEGMSCLDVGCGACDAMKLMGKFVGQTGSVTGLDINADLGNQSVEALRSTDLSKFEFIQGDANHIDTIPNHSYDITFARLFLLHQTDPVHSLRQMWQWTKPGGYMIAMDYDFQVLSAYPPYEPIKSFARCTHEVFKRTGKDPFIGVKLLNHFESACGSSPDTPHVWGILHSLLNIKDVVASSYRSILPAAVKLNVITQEEADLHIKSIEQVTESQPYYFGALMVGVYKQKVI